MDPEKERMAEQITSQEADAVVGDLARAKENGCAAMPLALNSELARVVFDRAEFEWSIDPRVLILMTVAKREFKATHEVTSQILLDEFLQPVKKSRDDGT